METTTLWRDTKLVSLDQVKEKFLSEKENCVRKNSEGEITLEYEEIHADLKNMDADSCIDIDNETWQICKFDYQYTLIKYSDNTPESFNKTGFVVALSNGKEVKYFINMYGNSAQTVLQLLLDNYNHASQVVEMDSGIHSPFLLWIFERFYSSKNLFTVPTSANGNKYITQLSIESILALKGSTNDQIAVIDADGDDNITGYVSVLSFILESSGLHKLGLRVGFDKHNMIEFLVDKPRRKIVVSTNIKNYEGPLKNNNIDTRTSKLICIINLVIIPKLISFYRNDEEWNSDTKQVFFNTIGDKIKSETDVLLQSVKDKFIVDGNQEQLDI